MAPRNKGVEYTFRDHYIAQCKNNPVYFHEFPGYFLAAAWILEVEN
jgi:hypothetical protein